MWKEFEDRRDESGFARHIVRADQAPLGVRILQEGLGSLRGAIGSPEQVKDLLSRYDAAGVDQVIFILQAGRNRHQHICESLELFAEKVMPGFVEGRLEREEGKAQRLSGCIEAALARREPARTLGSPYVIDEQAELARARRRRRQRRRLGAAQVKELALAEARRQTRERAVGVLARLVAGASDAALERRFGASVVQRALFAGMARSFEPDAAAGFQGQRRVRAGPSGDRR